MKRKSIIYLGVALISFVLLNGNVRAEENIQLTDTDIESIGDNDAVKSEMHFGWLLVDSKWYYFEEPNMEHPGEMVKDCVMTIGEMFAVCPNRVLNVIPVVMACTIMWVCMVLRVLISG